MTILVSGFETLQEEEEDAEECWGKIFYQKHAVCKKRLYMWTNIALK